MADLCSFDVVSQVNMQEVRNAVDQTMKEIRQRFDFKGSKTDVTLKENEGELVVITDDEYKLKAVVEILKAKFAKRQVSLKAMVYGKMEEALGGTVRQVISIQRGIAADKAKALSKEVRDAKFKVQTQIQGDQLRVQGKSRDELQAVIAFLKQKDFGIDLQFVNYR